MPSGKYLEKEVKVDCGYTPNCWRCENLRISIGDTVTVTMGMFGYKDAASCIAGEKPAGTKEIVLENAQGMQEYHEVFQVFLRKIVKTETFKDAALKDL